MPVPVEVTLGDHQIYEGDFISGDQHDKHAKEKMFAPYALSNCTLVSTDNKTASERHVDSQK